MQRALGTAAGSAFKRLPKSAFQSHSQHRSNSTDRINTTQNTTRSTPTDISPLKEIRRQSPLEENLHPLRGTHMGLDYGKYLDRVTERIGRGIDGVSSPFIEKTMPNITFIQPTPESKLPKVKQGHARLVHGTSRKALESIQEHGITQPLYITSNIREASSYAKKQAEFDKTEEVLIIIDAKNIQKNEYDRFYTYDGDIQLVIPTKDKEDPQHKAELDAIANAGSTALIAQVTGAAVLMSSPIALDGLITILVA